MMEKKVSQDLDGVSRGVKTCLTSLPDADHDRVVDAPRVAVAGERAVKKDPGIDVEDGLGAIPEAERRLVYANQGWGYTYVP